MEVRAFHQHNCDNVDLTGCSSNGIRNAASAGVGGWHDTELQARAIHACLWLLLWQIDCFYMPE